MNYKEERNYQIFSVIFTFVLGTLLHFTYKLSGENPFVAIFSSVNESVWEHLKLLFFPMALTTVFGSFYFGNNVPNFLCAKTLGIISSILFIVVFYYTYTGIVGKNIAVVDIASFFVAVILGEFLSYRLIANEFQCNYRVAVSVLIIFTILFILFTFRTPKCGIFKDPVTGQY